MYTVRDLLFFVAYLTGMRVEVGQDVVDSVCEGLVMLQEQGMRSTCLWTCVMCDQKFTQAKDFLSHIEVAHEEVAVQVGVRSCDIAYAGWLTLVTQHCYGHTPVWASYGSIHGCLHTE